MAILDASFAQASISINAGGGGGVDFLTLVSNSANFIAWSTTDGNRISATSFAGDIAVSAGVPTAGTINALTATTSTGLAIYSVSGLTAGLTTLTGAPNLENYWRAILAGATTIKLPQGVFGSFSGDFLSVGVETLTGGADNFIGQNGFSSLMFLNGDANDVAAGGNLHGGADRMVVTSDCVLAGDAGTNAGTVTGGNDNLLFIETHIGTGPLVAGDVFTNAGDCTGGADVIEVRDGTLRFLAGDAFEHQSGILRGGIDRITYVRGAVSVTAGEADTISGGTVFAGADFITGSAANDVINGEFRSMTGGTLVINATYTGADRLSGGAGADTLNGQIGNDVLNGGSGGDLLNGGDGLDSADYRAESAITLDLLLNTSGLAAAGDVLVSIEQVLGSDSGNDAIVGTNGAERFYGYSGNDFLSGRGGNDVLMGNTGNDILSGGTGRDTLTGFVGIDRFDFNAIIESTPLLPDQITDFVHGVDKLDLSTIDASAAGIGDQAFSFIGTAAFTAEGQARAFGSGANTILELNTTGAGGAEMVIRLTGAIALALGDFVP